MADKFRLPRERIILKLVLIQDDINIVTPVTSDGILWWYGLDNLKTKCTVKNAWAITIEEIVRIISRDIRSISYYDKSRNNFIPLTEYAS